MVYEIKKLKDVSYLAGRIGWKGLTAKEYTKHGPLFLSVHSLNYGDYVDFIDAFHISQERYDESPEIMLRNNDILLCKDGAGIGKLGIIDRLPGPASINSSLLLIRANEEVEPKYLYRVLCGPLFQRVVQERIDGATTPHLYQREIKELEVPLPPLPEQKRIVAILDEAFAGIDQAIANTEKNLASAREIFESYLNDVFTRKGEGWEEKRLGEVCDVIGGGTPSKNNEDFYDGSLPWATVRDMRSDVIDKTEYNISEDAVINSSTNVIPRGNIVIATRVGLGKVCYLACDTAINQDLKGVIPKKTLETDVLFLFWWFKSISHLIVRAGTGATVQGVKLSFVKSLEIPLPLLSEQKKIVGQLEGLRTDIKKLESFYNKKLTSLNELKQSLLQKAFNGELTADMAANAEAAE